MREIAGILNFFVNFMLKSLVPNYLARSELIDSRKIILASLSIGSQYSHLEVASVV